MSGQHSHCFSELPVLCVHGNAAGRCTVTIVSGSGDFGSGGDEDEILKHVLKPDPISRLIVGFDVDSMDSGHKSGGKLDKLDHVPSKSDCLKTFHSCSGRSFAVELRRDNLHDLSSLMRNRGLMIELMCGSGSDSFC